MKSVKISGQLESEVRNQLFLMEKLEIYKKSLYLTKLIYLLIKNNSLLSKDFSLCDQIKRAAVSVGANIAEGYCRTRKQFINYLNIASGSTNEIVHLLKIIQLVYNIDTTELQREYAYLGKQIISLSKKIKFKS